MEPDNSQFSEVPAEEATEAVSSDKPKKAAKPRPSKAAKPISGPVQENPEIDLREVQVPEELQNEGNLNYIPAMDQRGTDAAIKRGSGSIKAYKRNKRDLLGKDMPQEEDTTDVTEGVTLDPHIAHAAGRHGLIQKASVEQLRDLPNASRILMNTHAHECESCAHNKELYESQVLPEEHEAGKHSGGATLEDDESFTVGGASMGVNMVPSCTGCIDDAISMAKNHKKENHTLFPESIRGIFRRNGCASCQRNNDKVIAEEHTMGDHVDEPHPTCPECKETRDAQEASEAESSPYRAAMLAKRSKLGRIAKYISVTRTLPNRTEEQAAKYGIAGVPDETVTTNIRRAGIPIEGTIATDPVVKRGRNMLGAIAAQKAADEQKMWDDYLRGAPNYQGFSLGEKAVPETLTERGRTAGATEAQQEEFRGGPGREGTKKYIPVALHDRLKTNIKETPSGEETNAEWEKAKKVKKHVPYVGPSEEEMAEAQAVSTAADAGRVERENRPPRDPNPTSTYTGPIVRGRGPVPRGPVEALNCSGCGKMISPVRGTADPITGQVPQELCRNCKNEAINPDLPTQSKLNPKVRNSSFNIPTED